MKPRDEGMARVVMVVSPRNSLREAIEQMLEKEGYVVCPGVSKLAAFRHAINASETPPNVILLDFWLGLAETTSFIRGLKRQGFSVILMGTKFLGKDLAAQEGIRFLQKPFTRLELFKTI